MTPIVLSRECRARRRAGVFLLLPSALTLFIPRTTRRRPPTSTTTSTAASSSKKCTKHHSNRRYWLGSLEQHHHCLGSPSSYIVEDYWKTASGVAEHDRLGLLRYRFWGRCTVIIVDRWGIVSPGVTHRGLAGVSPPESPHNYCGIAGEPSFGTGSQHIWDCRGRTPFGIAASSSAIVWDNCNKRLRSLDVIITFRVAGTSFWGRWTSSSR